MKVKIDTKEKFVVVIIEEANITANMTEELNNTLLPYMNTEQSNVVLNLKYTLELDAVAGETIAGIQQAFYDSNHSMVVCCLQPAVEKILDENELLEVMNVTPTESEAGDIVQMEEIERELLL